MRIQILGSDRIKASQSVKVVGDGATEVRMNISPPIESDNFLNWTVKAYLTYNLTFGALKYHGIMTALTETS